MDELDRQATRIALEKFKPWTGGRQPRERGPVKPDPAPFSASYGPHLCAACYGVGWMRATADDKIGELVKCETCGTVDAAALNRTIAQCWQVSGLSVNGGLTLATFQSSSPERAAMIKAAAAFTRKPQGWLTLHGPFGGGKTHILEGIARHLLAAKVPTLYVKVGHLLEWCGAVERHEGDETDYAGRRRWVAEVPVLIIDEFNSERVSKAIFDYRREILDRRYQDATNGRGGATVLASNDAPDAWQDGAIGSRAQDQRFSVIACPKVDYRRSGR